MRAFVVAEPGAEPRVAEVAVPRPEAGEVQVAIEASSVNGLDLHVVAGALADVIEHRYPLVPGKDFAGTVTAVGEGVTRFQVGDPVFGVDAKPYIGGGSFAEFLTVPATGVAHRPPALSPADAAALAWAGLTAHENVEALDPGPGDIVLVLGASGGVGGLAVQLAAARGATVIATGLPADEQRLRELGAAHFVDYTAGVPAQVGSLFPNGVTALLSLVVIADGDAGPLADLVTDGGRIATTMGGFDGGRLSTRGIALTEAWTQPDADRLDVLARLAADGGLRLPVQGGFPLADAAAALDAFRQGSRGKIVVAVA